MMTLYQTQGFKSMIKSNPNMSQFLGVIRQDFIKDGDKDMISAQITGRSTNMMDFSRMLERLKTSIDREAEQKEQFAKSPSVKINILYDKNAKDIGVLVKLNNLMKRLELVRYLIGDWKNTNSRYGTMTE
jgi:hypothetical protein